MKIRENTKVFSGILKAGFKFVIAITPRTDGLAGWDGECIISETKTGEIVDAFIRDYPDHYKASGVVQVMKQKARMNMQ